MPKKPKTPPKKKDHNWVQPPERPDGCPPGLEYLIDVNELNVNQAIELFEILCCETENKYWVSNKDGQKMFFMQENSHFCKRWICGQLRSFTMSVTDSRENEVLYFERPKRCDNCCFFCCLQVLRVFDSTHKQLGTIKQLCSFCRPWLCIKDENNKKVFYVKGPCFLTSWCKCCCTQRYKVLKTDKKTEVGIISKKFGGVLKEMFTDADVFGVTFPKDLDVKLKGLLLGALMLIDYLFYENAERCKGLGCLTNALD